MTMVRKNNLIGGISISLNKMGFIFSTVTVLILFISIICLGSASVEQNVFANNTNISDSEVNGTSFLNQNESHIIVSTNQHLRVHKLNLSIYYETLCPFSIDFIRNQLNTTWTKIGNKYLDLKFVPYGNGHTFFKPGLVMTGCQHGEWECSGNKMHACALEYLSREQSTAFIFCSMSKDFPPDAAENCTKELGISPADFEMVKTCHTSIAGDLALALKGLMSLDFITNGVPGLAINGMLVESDDIYDNLFGYICDEFKSLNDKLVNGTEVPDQCIEHLPMTPLKYIVPETTTTSSNISSINKV